MRINKESEKNHTRRFKMNLEDFSLEIHADEVLGELRGSEMG